MNRINVKEFDFFNGSNCIIESSIKNGNLIMAIEDFKDRKSNIELQSSEVGRLINVLLGYMIETDNLYTLQNHCGLDLKNKQITVDLIELSKKIKGEK